MNRETRTFEPVLRVLELVSRVISKSLRGWRLHCVAVGVGVSVDIEVDADVVTTQFRSPRAVATRGLNVDVDIDVDVTKARLEWSRLAWRNMCKSEWKSCVSLMHAKLEIRDDIVSMIVSGPPSTLTRRVQGAQATRLGKQTTSLLTTKRQRTCAESGAREAFAHRSLRSGAIRFEEMQSPTNGRAILKRWGAPGLQQTAGSPGGCGAKLATSWGTPSDPSASA